MGTERWRSIPVSNVEARYPETRNDKQTEILDNAGEEKWYEATLRWMMTMMTMMRNEVTLNDSRCLCEDSVRRRRIGAEESGNYGIIRSIKPRDYDYFIMH
eukprot:Selendium_serpulae@DN4961_c0_g2_i4.p1